MDNDSLNSYELSRAWFDFCFVNPEKVKPNHTAVFFFAIEHCNRLGWKSKFGFPTSMAMEATGIKSYNTYIKAFNDIVLFGFFTLFEKSKNQYSSNVIALSINNKANNKALDKALIKHTTKQEESTHQSTVQITDSIDKQYNNKQYNKEQGKEVEEEKKADEDKIEFQKIVDIFNSVCKELPKVQKITPKRKSAIRARIRDYNLSTVYKVFELVSQSGFLNGKSEREWVADFDWIMAPNNFVKILEGKYNRDKQKQKVVTNR